VAPRFAVVFFAPLLAAEVFLVELLLAALLFADDFELRPFVAVVLAAIALEPVLRVAFFKSPSMKGHPTFFFVILGRVTVTLDGRDTRLAISN
jgi:hypothetical protein